MFPPLIKLKYPPIVLDIKKRDYGFLSPYFMFMELYAYNQIYLLRPKYPRTLGVSPSSAPGNTYFS